jgi:transaldolase
MKVDLDSADLDEPTALCEFGFIDGATLISPFVSPSDDIGRDGIGLIEEICTLYANYDCPTKILVASVRSTQHVVKATLMGANVVTLPPKILPALIHHPLADSGLDVFNATLAKKRAAKLVA